MTRAALRGSRRRATLLAGLALSLTAAACGGDERTATVVGEPPASVTSEAPSSTPATVPTATTPTAPPASTTTTPTATAGVPSGGEQAPDDNGGTPAGGEQAPGGAGDEEAARVPASFTLTDATISPPQITVPAFLAIDLALSAKGGAQTVTVAVPGAGRIDVAAGGTARKQLPGLKPGDYAVSTAAGGKATLHVVSGGDPGP
ncbi:MAG TPA: hypothetical protein VK501_22725 [Baekduia sp.]|uniref:hypothetical protein n=1 Tax=Baekduia sp. TaxID=2600305 RepID=UPI002BFA3902|nr:hypothetical protein [Baekduia sp.]HMJ36738.1 hypothetical protein [Baekduia sp.]